MSYSGQSVPSGSSESRPLGWVPPAESEEYYHELITYLGHSTGFPSTGSGSVATAPEHSAGLHQNPRYDHHDYFQYSAVPCVDVQPNHWAPTFSVPQILLDPSPALHFGVTSSSYTHANFGPSPRVSIQTSSPASLEEGPNILSPGFVAFGTYPSNASFSEGDDEDMGTLMANNFDGFGGPSNSLEDWDESDFMEGVRSTGPSSPAEHLSRAPSPQYELNEDQLGWSNIGQSHVCLPANDYDTLNTSLRPPPVDRNSKQLLASPAMQGKRSSSRTREQIDKAKAVRDVRACVRCQVLHLDCGVSGECDSCRVAWHNGTVHKMPCLRARLTDTRLFRSGSLMFPDGVIPKLNASSRARKPKLKVFLYHAGHMEPFGAPQDRPRVEVVCQEFNPTKAPPQISLSKSWINHSKKIDLHLPAYAIPSGQLNKTADKLILLLENNWQQLASELIQSQRDKIVSSTLVEAVRNVGKCKMLKGALDIAILSGLISKSFNLTGTETFGLSPVTDPESPYYGRIPLPPFLDAQLDNLIMRKLKKIQKKTLAELNDTMLGSNKRKDWLMIFLTIFVLNLNLEFIYQNQDRQMKRYLSQQRISGMNDWEPSAKILNTYFHETCHGEIPFYMDWTHEAQKVGGIDRQTLEYLDALKHLLKSREAELRSQARGRPGEPLVWISALFMPPTEDLR